MARILLTLSFGALVGIAGWWTTFLNGKLTEHTRQIELRDEQIGRLGDELQVKDGRIEELGVEVEQKRRKIHELEVSLRLVKVDRRVARFEVIEQGPDPADSSRTMTRLRFVELGPGGEPIGEGREITIEGKVLYVEGLVIKFEDSYVEAGDFLRGASICLLRRAFSEHQTPRDGVELDRVGMHPAPYASDDVPELYLELWERFWDYANDPAAASAKGVRAIHGEAPFIELRPDKTYRVELRSSGGLSIRAE